ncbi:hypothetical protein Q7C36_021019 [Tachysurus vachellii]|uniref:DUF3456 domain-containing protein n=1 Tax=Tachysurus vachellii TaxID=175792 RepID=A0AA88IRH3_TACVA|nr:hypothetical protein Q7C36_021019 [Tachysurus vachellii]
MISVKCEVWSQCQLLSSVYLCCKVNIMMKLLDLLFLWILLSFTTLMQGARQSQDIRCGACRALVDEMEWAIAQVDPKKLIQTGSFRINPDGSQSVKDVPFARSEGHLLELMEGVCEKMKDYGETLDPVTKRKKYVRFTARDGTSEEVSNVSYDSRVVSSLKFACETIVEQNEDEIIEFFSHETDNVKDKLCSKRTDLCDHALKIPHDEL